MTQQEFLGLYLPLLSPLATVSVVMIGFLYNNSRLSDFRDAIRAELSLTRDMLRAEIKVLEERIDKNHSEVLAKFSELDGRVSRLEGLRGAP